MLLRRSCLCDGINVAFGCSHKNLFIALVEFFDTTLAGSIIVWNIDQNFVGKCVYFENISHCSCQQPTTGTSVVGNYAVIVATPVPPSSSSCQVTAGRYSFSNQGRDLKDQRHQGIIVVDFTIYQE
ncbi:unnamed protein product [Caenorhabditis angaria]|uniref:Uncharacterized protein n=1 Tax=Caenorhabditis angaria TaxID=860376 RepID=A0A9P1IYH5_9PELO|nr:unnamed protein product [Caenorhabditis angaria]